MSARILHRRRCWRRELAPHLSAPLLLVGAARAAFPRARIPSRGVLPWPRLPDAQEAHGQFEVVVTSPGIGDFASTRPPEEALLNNIVGDMRLGWGSLVPRTIQAGEAREPP